MLGSSLVALHTPEGGYDYVSPLSGLAFRVYVRNARVYADWGRWSEIPLYPNGRGFKARDEAADVSKWLADRVMEAMS